MRILQITSDWKWTGPAEPMLQLSLALRGRGVGVDLVCAEPPAHASRSLLDEARAAGLTPALLLGHGRAPRGWRDAREVARLRRLVAARRPDLLHAWHSRDHLLALAASASLRPRVPLVRSYRRAEPIPSAPWNRWLFGPGTDGLLCVSPESARRNARLRGGRPFAGAFGAVDPARFFPARPEPRMREALGLKPEHRVVGIVARAQRHRRFDLLLEAARRLFARDAQARLLVVGRGTHIAEVAERPARRLGIAGRVVFAGYLTDGYADALRSIDVFTLLVPGSDGTCRALLEAAACGIPAVTTRRGALPEIVVDGETGLLAAEDPEALADAWQALLESPRRRAALGAAAARRARALFTPERFAELTLALYRAVRSVDSGS